MQIGVTSSETHVTTGMGIESFVAASPLLGIYPSNKFSEVHQDEVTGVFLAALFALAKVWNQLNVML